MTFDDGPDPIWTPKVLEALHQSGAKATFFVIAPLALRFPHLVRQMTQSGHAVELHCSNHVRHTELTRAEVEEDARGGLRTLRDLGSPPTLWRTPWGAVAPWTRALANDLGLELVAWTIDTHDWRGDAASQMLARVRPDLQPGSIVLMHDALGPGARREGCEETVTLLEKLVEHARFLGCKPRPMSVAPARYSTA